MLELCLSVAYKLDLGPTSLSKNLTSETFCDIPNHHFMFG